MNEANSGSGFEEQVARLREDLHGLSPRLNPMRLLSGICLALILAALGAAVYLLVSTLLRLIGNMPWRWRGMETTAVVLLFVWLPVAGLFSVLDRRDRAARQRRSRAVLGRYPHPVRVAALARAWREAIEDRKRTSRTIMSMLVTEHPGATPEEVAEQTLAALFANPDLPQAAP